MVAFKITEAQRKKTFKHNLKLKSEELIVYLKTYWNYDGQKINDYYKQDRKTLKKFILNRIEIDLSEAPEESNRKYFLQQSDSLLNGQEKVKYIKLLYSCAADLLTAEILKKDNSLF
jgi:hypothetical protein